MEYSNSLHGYIMKLDSERELDGTNENLIDVLSDFTEKTEYVDHLKKLNVDLRNQVASLDAEKKSLNSQMSERKLAVIKKEELQKILDLHEDPKEEMISKMLELLAYCRLLSHINFTMISKKHLSGYITNSKTGKKANFKIDMNDNEEKINKELWDAVSRSQDSS